MTCSIEYATIPIMSIEERTCADVDRRLARLRNRFGDFPVEEITVTNEADFFERGVDLVEEGWIGDAGAFVTDADDRVLLIQHAAGDGQWGTPGGGHEPGETLAETARREVREETGIECTLTGVVKARRKRVVHEDDERAFYMLTVEFVAESEGGPVSIGDEEIEAARWFDEPPERVDDFVVEAVAEWHED